MKKRTRWAIFLAVSVWPLYLLPPILFCRSRARQHQPTFPSTARPHLQQTRRPVSASRPREVEVLQRSYRAAFSARKTEVKELLTAERKASLLSPFPTKEDHISLTRIFRPFVDCPSLLQVGRVPKAQWTCGVETFLREKRSCLAYVFNRNVTDLSFELDLLNRTDCDVHLFDPFLDDEIKDSLLDRHARLHFHDWTVGEARDTRYLLDDLTPTVQSVEEVTLFATLVALDHSWIDILKLDYGDETYTKLAEMNTSWKRAKEDNRTRLGFPAGEIIFSASTHGDPLRLIRGILPLVNAGCVPFYAELDLGTERPWENIAFGFLNLRESLTFKLDAL